MVSFRFHIVSLIAVFLALALGIGMGVTVIDKATVDLLQRRLDSVRNEVNAANQRSDDLDRQLARTNAYETRAEEYLLNGQLAGAPVTVIALRGTDEGPLGEMRETLVSAGAALQGTLWITGKTDLDDPRNATVMARALGLDTLVASQLRTALLSQLNATLAGAGDQSMLQRLIDDGFLEWEGERASEVVRATLGASRLVLASSADADVSNEKIALPLVRLLAAQPSKRMVVVESGRDANGQTPASRAVFLGPVRADSSFDGKLSTVDNIETPPGRVATVLCLAQLANGRTGDYGYGGSTDGAIPKLGQ